MTCANPACGAEALYCGARIYSVDFLGATARRRECQSLRRRVIWLCDACTSLFAVETWRAAWTTSAAFQESSHRISSRPAPHFPGGETVS